MIAPATAIDASFALNANNLHFQSFHYTHCPEAGASTSGVEQGSPLRLPHG